jgi:hypothetical protein
VQNTAPTPPADGLTVTFATAPAPPVIGAGAVVLTLADRDGKPLADAQIEIEANMNHAGMKPEFGRAAGGPGGRYTIPLQWTMGGEWYVDVKATLPDGQIVKRRFPVSVQTK